MKTGAGAASAAVRVVWAAMLALGSGTAGLRAADCNGNGIADAEDIQTGASADCNGDLVPDECEWEPFVFEAFGDPEAVPSSARALRARDLDGDGDVDVVVLSRLTRSTVSVLRNAGRGTLEPPVRQEAPRRLYSLEITDLDGDGIPEALTAGGDALLVFSMGDDGGFGPPVELPVPSETRFAIPADLTGDGLPEVLTANRRSTTISIYPNDGGGGLGAPVDIEVAADPLAIAAGDLDGDSDIDVAVVSGRAGGPELTVLLNNGSGELAVRGMHLLENSRSNFIEMVDLDGDDLPEVIVSAGRQLFTLANRGGGELGEAVRYDTASVLSMAFADADGDGDRDVLLGGTAAGGGALSVRLNDGSGGLHMTTELSASLAATAMESVDIDEDGAPDVVGAGATAVFMLRNVYGVARVVTSETKDLFGCQRERGCRPHSGTTADLDGDGDEDVIACNTHPGSFSIALNEAGTLVPQRAYTFGGEHPQSVAAGDVDGDDDIDAVTVDNLSHDLWLHANDGAGGFERPRRFPIGNAPINVKLADVDNDGDLDAVSANQGANTVSIMLGNGQGVFSPARPRDIRVGSAPKAVEAADLDGDDDIDIAVANSSSPFVSVLIGNGDGTFRPAVNYGLPGFANHVASADLDNDGDLDLFTANTNRSNVSVLLNTGDGTFERARSFALGRQPYSVVAADFSGDGLLDLVTGNETTSSVSIVENVGDGEFRVSMHLPAGTGLRFVLPGDFDEDGDVDLVTTNREGRSLTIIDNDVEKPAPDYLESICTPRDFMRVSTEASESSRAGRFLKWTLPAEDSPDLLPSIVFQNTTRFPLHEGFLENVFPDRFPALDPDVYDALVGRRATRRYFVGTVSRFRSLDGVAYGFSLFVRWNDDAERLSASEVKRIHDQLRESFHLEPFYYYPNSRDAVEAASEWENPGFPILDLALPPGERFTAYTRGVGYGRVRVLGRDEFERANEGGRLSFQDIIVLDHAPRDIEGVVGGVLTAEPQGELSHVAVRTSRRGTPNAFVHDAPAVLAPLNGKIARLEVGSRGYTIEEVALEDAERFWTHNRPRLSTMPAVDFDTRSILTLDEIAALAAAGEPVESRFGGKASNMARLQSVLVGDLERYREVGFAIPMAYYRDFMTSNRMRSALDSAREVTYQEYVEELAASDVFRTDSAFRFEALHALREAMQDDGVVSPALVRQLAVKVAQVFGGTSDRVRFRSSSNVEDAIEFNGAGLYDSTSACAADDLDSNDDGPSRCDPARRNERGIARALRIVWSSLWNFRAHEERAFYSIPEEIAAMGILVTRAFIDERANGVAFTGNPANRLDRRYVVTAQVGEESVVSPAPGVLPERNVLEIEDGRVVSIIRSVASSLLPRGAHVLSDAELEELGALLWTVDRDLPIDTSPYPRSEVLLDFEFKIERNGDLAVKQVRPFLLTGPEPDESTFTLEISADSSACGMFVFGREARQEYELKSVLRFVPETVELPAALESFSARLVESIELGPERRVAVADGPGTVTVRTSNRPENGVVAYTFDYRQELLLPDGTPFELELLDLTFETRDGIPVQPVRVVDAELLTHGVSLRGSYSVGEEVVDVVDIVYSSCSHETLPLWEVRAELEDGTTISLDERLRPDDALDSVPASIVGARVHVDGVRWSVRDYWKLVYSAARHNTHEVYWVILDPPATAPGIAEPVHAVELRAPVELDEIEGEASYLGEDFQVLATLPLRSWERLPGLRDDVELRRGDANADSALNIADALFILGFVYTRGPEPPCIAAADADDGGSVNGTDAVVILRALFLAMAPPVPLFEACAPDPTPDRLTCRAYPPCER